MAISYITRYARASRAPWWKPARAPSSSLAYSLHVRFHAPHGQNFLFYTLQLRATSTGGDGRAAASHRPSRATRGPVDTCQSPVKNRFALSSTSRLTRRTDRAEAHRGSTPSPSARVVRRPLPDGSPASIARGPRPDAGPEESHFETFHPVACFPCVTAPSGSPYPPRRSIRSH